MSLLLERRQIFLELLDAEQDLRDQRRDFVLWQGKMVCQWQRDELEALLVKINEFRTLAGTPLLDMPHLLSVESMAMGHIDYTRKLALYAAELSMSINDWVPR